MKQLTLTDISKFLTQEVIEKAFRIKTKSEDNVKCIEVSRAAPVGDGNLSLILRIQVTGYHHSTSFIAKGFINNLVLLRSLDCPKYFKRESDFFSIILPTFIKLQISLGAKERIQHHIPICYGYHQDGINDFLLLEDLSDAGCSNSAIQSEDQKNDVIKTLAHFHAVSMALRVCQPEVFNEIISPLPETYLSEQNREWYAKYLSGALDIDRKVMDELEDPDSIYFKKFGEVLNSDVYGQIVASVTARCEHPVLCHGDAWSNNFLTSPKRTVAIDFQVARCASPATDLAYWNILNCNAQTVKQDVLDAIDIYYNALKYYLGDMGLDVEEVYPRTSLDNDLKLYGRYGFLACLTTLPLLASDKDNFFDYTKDIFTDSENMIPLESIWKLTPMEKMQDKLKLVNAVHIAVDTGLI